MNETKSDNPQNTTSNGLILIAVLLVFGLVLGGFGMYRYNMGKKSTSWPSANGRITYSHASPHSEKNGTQYMPTVRYTYAVKGKSYTGTRITASDQYQKNISSANDILRDYPVGKGVAVYYNPSDPAVSLLEIGIQGNVYVMLAGAGGCFLFAVFIAVSLLKKRSTG